MKQRDELDRPGMRRSRRAVETEVDIRDGQDVWRCGVLDLSMSGVRLRRPSGFDTSIGAPLRVELIVASGAECRIEARVVRVSRDEVALSFEHLGADGDARLADYLDKTGHLLDAVDGH